MAVGGAFATTAVLFSCGERHLPPLLRVAAGAVRGGAGGRGRRAADSAAGRSARVVAPLAVLAGVVVELVVRARLPGAADVAGSRC